jgi:hypothetical protein
MGDTRPYPIQKTNYVLGTEYEVSRTQYRVPGTKYPVMCTRYRVPWTEYSVRPCAKYLKQTIES